MATCPPSFSMWSGHGYKALLSALVSKALRNKVTAGSATIVSTRSRTSTNTSTLGYKVGKTAMEYPFPYSQEREWELALAIRSMTILFSVSLSRVEWR